MLIEDLSSTIGGEIILILIWFFGESSMILTCGLLPLFFKFYSVNLGGRIVSYLAPASSKVSGTILISASLCLFLRFSTDLEGAILGGTGLLIFFRVEACFPFFILPGPFI